MLHMPVEQALGALPLPLRVLGGSLGDVRVSVPWRNLGTEAMSVTISNVYIVACAKKDDETVDVEAEGESRRVLIEATEVVEEKKEAGQSVRGFALADC